MNGQGVSRSRMNWAKCLQTGNKISILIDSFVCNTFMILQATHPTILFGAAWLQTSKGFLLVVHSSDVIDQLRFLTKLLSTACFHGLTRFHAGVRLLPVMNNLDVPFKCELPTKCPVTI